MVLSDEIYYTVVTKNLLGYGAIEKKVSDQWV